MGRPPKSDIHPELQKWLRQIGANLQALRQDKGMTQAQLSKKSKISITTINEIESRRFRDIRMSTIVSLALGLDIQVIYLLRVSDIKLRATDQTKLLRASEDILRIAKKISDND
jgi:transcriptional regulator with XRE-family HTH domain